MAVQRTLIFSSFIFSRAFCCSLILLSSSCSRRRISSWSWRFSSSRCRCIVVIKLLLLLLLLDRPPMPMLTPPGTPIAAAALLLTRSFSSDPKPVDRRSGDRLGDLVLDRLSRVGLRFFLEFKFKR